MLLSVDFIVDFRSLNCIAPIRDQVVLHQPSFVRTRRIWLGDICRPMAGYFLEAFACIGNRFANAVEPGLVAMENNQASDQPARMDWSLFAGDGNFLHGLVLASRTLELVFAFRPEESVFN